MSRSKLWQRPLLYTVLAALAVSAGCAPAPVREKASHEPEILTVYPDGRMKLKDHPVPEEDVVIYADGLGGERAAVKVRIAPLHPDYYRDSIIVRRIAGDFEAAAGEGIEVD